MLKDKLNLINSEDYSDDIDITLTYYINKGYALLYPYCMSDYYNHLFDRLISIKMT